MTLFGKNNSCGSGKESNQFGQEIKWFGKEINCVDWQSFHFGRK